MKTIDDILHYFNTKERAMIVRPATADDLSLCQRYMSELEYPPIPQEYADFLSKLNGFAWNGIQIHGTDQVTNPVNNFTLKDIVTANEDFYEYCEGFEHYFYFGDAGEWFYIYNTESKRWGVMERSGRAVLKEYDTFEEFFVTEVSRRI